MHLSSAPQGASNAPQTATSNTKEAATASISELVVIVLNIGKQVVGMVVDGVSDVITLAPEQLRPVPEFSSAIDSDHVLAIGSIDMRMLILLDIEKLMTSAAMGLVAPTIQ